MMREKCLEEKFIERIEKRGSCWIWTGQTSKSEGYGKFRINDKSIYAHRWSYERFIGPLGELFACHHCDTPSCVNPDHIFPGTPSDNTRDMSRKGRSFHSKKTHCPQGHEYTPENTYRDKNNHRFCVTCSKARAAAARGKVRVTCYGCNKEFSKEVAEFRKSNGGTRSFCNVECYRKSFSSGKKMVSFVCSGCGKESKKEKRKLDQAIKQGKAPHCSKSCASRHNGRKSQGRGIKNL